MSHFVSITDNEDKGIKEIISFYGGYCEYGFENKVSTGKGKESIFWIKFSKSASIDSTAKLADLHGSNMAYLFYKNLDKEKTKYTTIKSEIIFGNGKTLTYTYPITELEKSKIKNAPGPQNGKPHQG